MALYEILADGTPKRIAGSIGDFVQYPVGAIYMSMESTSPALLFGGSWEQIKDRFLLGAGGDYPVGDAGGEATHKLTTSELPSHTHNFSWSGSHSHNITDPGHVHKITTSGSDSSGSYVDTGDKATNVDKASTSNKTTGITINSATISVGGTTGSSGSGNSHNNMPPYLSVYIWKRVA